MSRRDELRTPLFERTPAPVDHFGLVKKKPLLQLVQAGFEERYPCDHGLWHANQSMHHLYGPRVLYTGSDLEVLSLSAIQRNRREFRALEINQMALGRIPHDVLHETIEFPVMPDDDVMHYRIQYAHLGRSAFMAAMWIIRLDRQLRRLRGELPSQGDIGTVRSRQRSIDRNLYKYHSAAERLAKIPEELHVVRVDPNQSLRHVARALGPLVLKPRTAEI